MATFETGNLIANGQILDGDDLLTGGPFGPCRQGTGFGQRRVAAQHALVGQLRRGQRRVVRGRCQALDLLGEVVDR